MKQQDSEFNDTKQNTCGSGTPATKGTPMPSAFVRLFDRAFRCFAVAVLRIYGRFFLGIHYYGTLPEELLHGGVLTVCNHVHYVDSCMVSCFCPKRTFYYPTLQANFRIPFVRHLLKHLCVLPVPRSPKALAHFGQTIHYLLKNGRAVHFFPEGSLLPYCRQLRPFQRGAFCYAYDCHVPIVPFVITFRKPTGFCAWFRKKPLLDLTVLEPIWPSRDAPRKIEIERLMRLCYERMSKQINSVSGPCGDPAPCADALPAAVS